MCVGLRDTVCQSGYTNPDVFTVPGEELTYNL